MSRTHTFKILQDNLWLKNLPEHAQKELLSAAKIISFKANQMVHRKNSQADGLYMVLIGEIRISATTISGKEVVFTRITPGQWFGEIALLDGGTRTHDGFTTVDSILAILPKKAVLNICQKYPEIYKAMVTLLCQHCRLAFQAIDNFLLLTPEQRMAQLLIQRFQNAQQNQINISQKELGALIGISRQSTNKILKSWEQNGTIKCIYRGLKIKCTNKLYAIIQSH